MEDRETHARRWRIMATPLHGHYLHPRLIDFPADKD
jgi:hypothetical protein